MNADDWKAEEEEFQRMIRQNHWNEATMNVSVPIKTKIVVPDAFRNAVLEEVAEELDKLMNLGDTSQNFATFVRSMKR
jgi:hypothetical protein